MSMYVGYGPEQGIRVPLEEAFEYAVANWDQLPEKDREQLFSAIAEGITECELVEIFFSGCFVLYKDELDI